MNGRQKETLNEKSKKFSMKDWKTKLKPFYIQSKTKSLNDGPIEKMFEWTKARLKKVLWIIKRKKSEWKADRKICLSNERMIKAKSDWVTKRLKKFLWIIKRILNEWPTNRSGLILFLNTRVSITNWKLLNR